MKQKIDKGCHGHLNEYKKLHIIHAIICIVVIIGLVVTGIMIYGSRRSVFTIVACIMAIPLAERLIGLGIVFNYSSIKRDNYNKLKEAGTSEKLLFDITVSNGEKIIYLPAVFINSENALIFTEKAINDEKYYKETIRKVFDLTELNVEFCKDIDTFINNINNLENDKPETDMQEMLKALGV